jgi:hypothetical protein
VAPPRHPGRFMPAACAAASTTPAGIAVVACAA